MTSQKHPNEKRHGKSHRDGDAAVPPPPDGGYGWVVVFASFICNMMIDGISYCAGIFLESLKDYYHEEEAKVSWVGSILTGVTMCLGPVVSVVANKFGCRASCMAGALVAGASFAVCIFSPTVEVLMLTYGVGGGIGFGLMYVPAVVCVGYYFESKRSLATGIAVCGSGVGTIVIAPLAKYLLELYGWKGANLALAAMCFGCVVMGFAMKPIEYKQREEKTVTMIYQNGNGLMQNDEKKSYTSLGDISASRHSIASNKSKKSNVLPPLSRQDVLYSGSIRNLKEFQSQKSLQDFRQSMLSIPKAKRDYAGGCSRMLKELVDVELMKDPVFITIALSNFLGFVGLYVPFVYIGGAAKEDGVDELKRPLLISIIGISNTVGRIVCGFIGDMPKVNTLLVNNICLLVLGISMGAMAFCHAFYSYAIAAFIYGTAMSGFISLTSILLVEFLGLEKLTNAFGNLILFRGTGSLLGPPLAGFIIKSSGYMQCFLAGCAFFAVSAGISFAIPFVQRTKLKKLEVEVDDSLTPVNLSKCIESSAV
ncbi:unnamed protein product [Phyllotreta striolata]|uniref:Major facilitator superfamily (MFS) profile domain-containing protein n=1 Tax=Phyllotreta striolata TaxID=444603 RepID=A0A9P0GT90_PHYSR|nr:unnamed protein product [Phyllotreta striolata]